MNEENGMSLTALDYIADNLAGVRGRIAAACRRAGRDVADVTLIAVSKTVGAAEAAAAYRAGVRHFGENRVEDALPKIAEVRGLLGAEAGPRWHMIGHVQRRKAREVAPAFDMVHSVDTLDLARELAKRLEPLGRELPILLEVNVSGEESKYGFRPADLPGAVAEILALPYVQVRGLMTMAPIGETPETARPHFRRLRMLRDDLARRFPGVLWTELSMGMTDDFEPAIEEGATLVRIGRAIFQPPQ
jgi:pyridoxal phosphate enzyme (YggS family)